MVSIEILFWYYPYSYNKSLIGCRYRLISCIIFVCIRNISMFTNTWLSKRMVSCIFDYIFVFNMILWYITEANKKIIYKRQMHLILVWEYIHLSFQERPRKYVFSIVMLKKGNWYPEKQTVTTMIQTGIMTNNSFSLRFLRNLVINLRDLLFCFHSSFVQV